jgi:hypothetical protein
MFWSQKRKNNNKIPINSPFLTSKALDLGVEGVVRGLESIHLADRCILTRLE